MTPPRAPLPAPSPAGREAKRDRAAAAGAASAPRVAAVVVTFRAEDAQITADCLRSLRESDHPALEIVLVDNGSPPAPIERLTEEFPEAVLVRTGENLGFTGGNNRGMAAALERGCEYVLLLNNDTVVRPDCVSRLVEAAAAEPRVGAVGAKIVYLDDPGRIWFGGGEFSPTRLLGLHRQEGEPDRDPQPRGAEEVTFLTGCCMLIPAAALREVGGFEEDFFAYVEDVELCHRLRSSGYRLIYQPAARLAHRVPLEEPEVAPYKIVLRDRNRRRMSRRRLSRTARLRFALFFYPSRAVLGLRYLLRGDLQRVRAIWQGMTAP